MKSTATRASQNGTWLRRQQSNRLSLKPLIRLDAVRIPGSKRDIPVRRIFVQTRLWREQAA